MEELTKNETLFTKNFILTSLSTFTLFTSFYFLLITLPFYIQKLGGTESEIGLIIGVYTLSAVFLRPFLGIGVDMIGRKTFLLAGSLIFFISMLLNAYDFSTLFAVSSAIAFVSVLLVLPISEIKVKRQNTPLFSKEALFSSALMFAVTLTYGSIVSFLPLFAQMQGITNPGVFFSVFALSLILIRAPGGKLSDIKGRKSVIVPGMILVALGLFVLSGAESLPSFLAAAVLYGMGFGLFHPAMMALLVDRINPRRDAEQRWVPSQPPLTWG